MNERRNLFRAGIAVLILLLYLACRPSFLVFKIEDADSGKLMFSCGVEPGFEFYTMIRHSVQRTPVYEFYRVEPDGSLVVTKTSLQDLGWGMPSTLQGPVTFTEGFMVMENINRRLNALFFRVSYLAEPRLMVKEKEITLDEFVPDGQLLKIHIDKEPWLYRILRGNTDVFQEKGKN
ncbi:MAG: DUF1850 domain-containing protein [Peptococcaceae bacterium]|jgi:hypothetical protein|nr:DUF1850 domain-containing protein [Peptococcaceae bacterium]MDH7523931.1 DUF1850 domain-containing protein [Peptococcaceae bacterium]